MGRLNLRDDVTHWPTSYGGRGEQIFQAPKHIKGKWEDSGELFMDGDGKEKMSKAVVYLNADVDVDDWVFLGKSSTGTPADGARRVAKFDKVNSLSGDFTERTAYLV